MEKPNRKDYSYSISGLTEYADQLEKYAEFIEQQNSMLEFQITQKLLS